jgi:hypothetical protein
MFEMLLATKKNTRTGIPSMPVSVEEVTSANFITAANLRTLTGFTAGTVVEPGTWLKFITESGSTLYIPKVQIAYTLSWGQLDALGIAQGQKVVTIGGRNYKVRLLHCSPTQVDTLAGSAGGSIATEAVVGSEWYNLFNSVRSSRPAAYKGPRLAAYTDTALQGSYGSLQYCYESLAGNTAQAALLYVNATGYFRPKTGNDSSDNTRGWRPVLELVP